MNAINETGLESQLTELANEAGSSKDARLELETYESPTLLELDASRRPSLRTVCETCTNSVWFTTPSEVSCYCRVMFLVTWSSSQPRQLTNCDGMYLNQEEQ